jgi:hypothetical protein
LTKVAASGGRGGGGGAAANPTPQPTTPSFATSNFKKAYEAAKPLRFADELLSALRLMITLYAKSVGVSINVAEEFFVSVQTEAFKNSNELLNKVQEASQRVWYGVPPLRPASPLATKKLLGRVWYGFFPLLHP